MTDADIRAQAADLIDGALDVLNVRGWCQGAWSKADGAVCLEGALTTAFVQASDCVVDYADRPWDWAHEKVPTELRLWIDAWAAAYRELANEAGYRFVSTFNDGCGRSVEDVALTAKRAAHSLRTEVA